MCPIINIVISRPDTTIIIKHRTIWFARKLNFSTDMILQGHMNLLKVFTCIFFKIINDMNWDVLGVLVWNDPSVVWPTEMHKFAYMKTKMC